MQPNRENIRAWVEALRSGHYKQARRRLRHKDSYCCLGVACCVYRQQTGQGEWAGEFFWGRPDGDKSDGYLPSAVARWLGVDTCNPTVSARVRRDTLAHLNDTEKATFAVIADRIEQEWLTSDDDKTEVR